MSISLSVLSKPSKEDFKKLKYYQKKGKKSVKGCTYVQALLLNVKKILKIKENFPNLLSNKIEKVHKTINEIKLY